MANDKKLIGWVEKVKVYPGGIEYRAKIDTGARNPSINARNIVEFERDGQPWVRFDLVRKKQARATLELPLVRQATIKRHFGKQQHRYVVMLGICLGGIYRETQVTLVDRTGFLYDLLLGRRFLKGEFIIDPSDCFCWDWDCFSTRQYIWDFRSPPDNRPMSGKWRSRLISLPITDRSR